MNSDLLISYLLASVVIIIIPGPNNLLVMNDCIMHGFRKSTLTVLGIGAGMAVLFSLSLAGITTLLMMFSWFFTVVKWIGAIFLFYLGISQILSSFKPTEALTDLPVDKKNFFTKGFLISVTNPKGLLFAGAYFPQFIRQDSGIVFQVLVLCGVFLLIGMGIGILYAAFSKSVVRIFKTRRFKDRLNRFSGVALLVFGLGLLIMSKEKS